MVSPWRGAWRLTPWSYLEIPVTVKLCVPPQQSWGVSTDGLDLTGQDLQSIRYQLLHRTASAVIEANRFHAQTAIMLVHSFSQEDMWYEDFTDFSALFGIAPIKDHAHFAGQKSVEDLYLGWIVGNSEYLER
ncbi:MAG: DUF6946 family protein [bacterium]